MDKEACDGRQGDLVPYKTIGSSSKATEGCCKASVGPIGDRIP